MVIVVDDEDRENEGDLTIAAEKVTPEAINFMAQLRPRPDLPVDDAERLDELEIPLMVTQNTSRFDTRSACRSRRSTATTHRHLRGRSRGDGAGGHRSRRRKPPDLARPGHMFPLRARAGGVLVRAGQTEAAVDLARIAGLYPAGVICEIMNDDGTMARVPELTKFAKRHGLLMITIADLIKYRMRTESLVKRGRDGEAADRVRRVPTSTRSRTSSTSRRTSRSCCGDIGDGKDVLVRVHSQCLTGDVLHSVRCDCGAPARRRDASGSPRKGAACCCI